MARNAVEDRDLGWKEIQRELKKLSKMGVKVGVTSDKAVAEDGTNVAEYAAYNEEGTKHIPSRPFIRSWVDNDQKRINALMDAEYRAVLAGRKTAEDALRAIGEYGRSAVEKNISHGTFAPNGGWEENRPSTLRHKAKIGKGSSRPLIETERMKGAISYEVVKE